MNQNSSPPETKPKTKYKWFGKIETLEEAEKLIKDGGNGFYVLAVIQAALSYFLDWTMLIDGVLLAILAYLLKKRKNVWIAAILFAFVLVMLVTTTISRFGYEGYGGKNILLAIIAVYISFRALQAALYLRKTNQAAKRE